MSAREIGFVKAPLPPPLPSRLAVGSDGGLDVGVDLLVREAEPQERLRGADE